MFERVLLSLSAVLVCCMFTLSTRAQSPYSHWYLAQSITNPTSEDSDFFGVAVSGVGPDKVLIGADGDNTGAAGAGSVYLYSADGTLLNTYTNPTPEDSDYFGVAVSGVGAGMVLIGAHYDNTGATSAGSTYLYSTDGTLLNTYTNPTPETLDGFGYAVSGVGTDMVLIGAIGDKTGAAGAGSAYLYSTNGTLLNTYTNPTPGVGDNFGYAVSDVGTDKVLIGAPYDSAGALYAGSAYLYSTNGALLNTYTNPTPEDFDSFGIAVSGVGTDMVIIGAPYDNTDGSYAGSAHLYSTNGTLLSTYTNPTPDIDDRFGVAVSVVGNDKVLIGAPRDNTGGTNAGSAYLYEVVPVLRIRPSPDPDFVRISWIPDTGTNWVLQAIPNLMSTNWINAPSGANNPTLAPMAPARFFRLKQP